MKKYETGSRTSNRIEYLMYREKITEEILIKNIKRGLTQKVKAVCNLTPDRVRQILEGSSPTVLESCLIVQALGEKLENLYYQG